MINALLIFNNMEDFEKSGEFTRRHLAFEMPTERRKKGTYDKEES